MTECDHNYYKSKGGNYYWWLSYYPSISKTTCKFECQDQYVIWDSKCTSFCYGTATDQEATTKQSKFRAYAYASTLGECKPVM